MIKIKKLRLLKNSLIVVSTIGIVAPTTILSSDKTIDSSNEIDLNSTSVELPSLSLIKNDFSSSINVEINTDAYVYNSSPIPYYSLNASMDIDSNGFITLDNHSLLEVFINGNVAKYFLDIFKINQLVPNNFTIEDYLLPPMIDKIYNKINSDVNFLNKLELSRLYKTFDPNYKHEYFIKWDSSSSKYKVLNYKLTESKINSICALNNPNLKQLFKNVKEINLSNNNLMYIPDFNNLFNNRIASDIGGVNLNGLEVLNLEYNDLTYIDRNLYKIIKATVLPNLNVLGKIKLNHNNMPYYFLGNDFFPANSSQAKLDSDLCKKYVEYYTLKDVIVDVLLGLNIIEIEQIIDVILQFLLSQTKENIEATFYMGTYQCDKNNLNSYDIYLKYKTDMLSRYGLDVSDISPSVLCSCIINKPFGRHDGKFGNWTSDILNDILYNKDRTTHAISYFEPSISSHWMITYGDDYEGKMFVTGSTPFYVRMETTQSQINKINQGILKGFTYNEVEKKFELTGQLDLKPLTDYLAFNFCFETAIEFTNMPFFQTNSIVIDVVIPVFSVLGTTLVGLVTWFVLKKYFARKKREKIFNKENN